MREQEQRYFSVVTARISSCSWRGLEGYLVAALEQVREQNKICEQIVLKCGRLHSTFLKPF